MQLISVCVDERTRALTTRVTMRHHAERLVQAFDSVLVLCSRWVCVPLFSSNRRNLRQTL